MTTPFLPELLAPCHRHKKSVEMSVSLKRGLNGSGATVFALPLVSSANRRDFLGFKIHVDWLLLNVCQYFAYLKPECEKRTIILRYISSLFFLVLIGRVYQTMLDTPRVSSKCTQLFVFVSLFVVFFVVQ